MSRFKSTSGITRCGLRRNQNAAATIDLPDSADSGLTRDGLRRSAGVEVEASKLSTKQRESLDKSDFVFPDKAPGSGSYPIPDPAHAANALARSKGKPEEATVRRKVCSRFPDLASC